MGDFGINTLIERMDLSPSIKRLLINNGYKTVLDLSRDTLENVQKIFNKSQISDEYLGENAFLYLKSILHHDYGVTFSNEYEDFGLTDKDAVTRISALPLSLDLKLILSQELGIYTFGDLLTTDYKKIVYARNMKESYLVELKNYVHSLGCFIQNEEPTLDEILKTLKDSGFVLLEEVIDNPRLYTFLYENSIYTIDDLKNIGIDVYNLSGFDVLKQYELSEKLKALNVVLDKVNSVSLFETRKLLDEVKEKNILLKKKIVKKRKLIELLNDLKKQNMSLSSVDSELDEKINSLIDDINILSLKKSNKKRNK